jgi:hypothetical protein
MNNMELEIASEFIHMGTMFQRTGSFKKNKVNLAEKASKAMYELVTSPLKKTMTGFVCVYF